MTLVMVVGSPLMITVERVTGAEDSEKVVETKVLVVEGVEVVERVVVEEVVEDVVEDVVEEVVDVVDVEAAPQ